MFTFGMAHKIRVPLCRRLRDLLEATGKSYSVCMSTALHENTSFDGSFVVRFEELQALFNGQVYFMGYLSDTAVFNHLVDCTFLAFFEEGPSREQHDGERRDGMWLRGDHQPRRAFAGRPRSPDQRHRHQQVREAP